MLPPIPYATQSITEEDVAEVIRVLCSPNLTQGPEVPAFERAVAEAVGARRALAVCNGTSALHLACLALGVGPGDVVWTSPNSFVASANCARYCGADVDFVDIDPATYQVDPDAFAAKLETAARAGRVPKVVVVVHFGGMPCDLAPLAAAAERHGVRIIEDASHALGATYRGTAIGDSSYSDITVFSFHPVKIVTTGEGGMAVTNDDALASKLALYRSHGVTRDQHEMHTAAPGAWYYEQIELGFNYRLTDLQSALGRKQVERLPQFLGRRAELAARYATLLADVDCTLPVCPKDRTSAWHLYVIGVDAVRRAAVFQHLRSKRILVNVHYIPIHLQPYYLRLGFGAGDFPQAEAYYARAISLPLYYELSNEQQDHVVAELCDALRSA